ncbi:MAG: hypothetical protein ACOCRN_04355 [Spirochaetia bacterium]
MKKNKALTGLLLVAGILLVSPGFGQDTDTDEAGNEEVDPEEGAEEQEEIEPVSDDEIEQFASIQLTVRREQQEVEEAISEIRRSGSLTATEFRQLQQAVDAAGGDLEDVDEQLRENERYAEVITELADVHEQSNDIVAEAVAQSPVTESRFNELAILIANDQELSRDVNEIVVGELEEEQAQEQAEAEQENESQDEDDSDEQSESSD